MQLINKKNNEQYRVQKQKNAKLTITLWEWVTACRRKIVEV